MRKLWIILSIAYIFNYSTSFAQIYYDYPEVEEYDPEYSVEIGVEGGPAFTSSWGHTFDNEWDVQYSAGTYVKYKANQWIAFQSGLSVEKIGTKIAVVFTDNSGNQTGTGYIKYHLDYITMPILWKFDPIDKRFNLSCSVGAFASYLFNAQSILSPLPPGTPNDPNPGKETTYNAMGDFTKFNVGLDLGVGGNYHFSNGLKIGLELRNQLGLLHIYNNTPTNNFSFRTNSLQLLFRVAYRF